MLCKLEGDSGYGDSLANVREGKVDVRRHLLHSRQDEVAEAVSRIWAFAHDVRLQFDASRRHSVGIFEQDRVTEQEQHAADHERSEETYYAQDGVVDCCQAAAGRGEAPCLEVCAVGGEVVFVGSNATGVQFGQGRWRVIVNGVEGVEEGRFLHRHGGRLDVEGQTASSCFIVGWKGYE